MHRPLFLFIVSLAVCTGCSKQNSDRRPESVPEADSTADSLQPRILGQLPDFSLVDQTGTKVTLSDFRDRVWIGNFIFTRCLATCPRQTSILVRLLGDLKQHRQLDDIRIVSITVDPTFDTPEILAGYARSHGAVSDRWKFLSGSRDEIWNLSKDGFKLAVGEDLQTAGSPIFHSPHFVIVDRIGQIRGYFDSGDADVLKKLKASLDKVLSEQSRTSDRTVDSLPIYPYPQDVMAPNWLASRKAKQLATKEKSEIGLHPLIGSEKAGSKTARGTGQRWAAADKLTGAEVDTRRRSA
jgi:protein SCO1/2